MSNLAAVRNVITYQAPNGRTINICPDCEARLTHEGDWPCNEQGEEYCTVSHGLHEGVCDVHRWDYPEKEND